MLIVMRHGAAEEEIQRVVETIEEMGYQARPMPGQAAHHRRPGRQRRPGGRLPAGRAARRARKSSTSPSRTSRCRREWQAGVHRRPAAGGLTVGGDEVVVMAGPCSVESERQILDGRPRRARGRRHRPPGRRLQAAELALRVPGSRAARARAAGPGARGDRPADRHRGDGRRGAGPGRRGGRHRPARRAQHAELLAAQARGSLRQADPAQAGPLRHHPGAAALGRVPAGRGQPAGDPVRARHPRASTRPPAICST